MLLEGDPQRLQPRVQGPGDTWGSGRGGGGEREGQGREQAKEQACFYLKLGLFPGHYQLMRPRDRCSMNKASVGFCFSPQRLAEVEIKGHHSIPLSTGVHFFMLLILLGAVFYNL